METAPKNPKNQPGTPAPILVCFQDPGINFLFAQLLESHGVRTKVVEDVCALEGDTRIITEAQYFPQIDQKYWNQCLIVGNKTSLQGIQAPSLSQPLTEEKIEAALGKFLRT